MSHYQLKLDVERHLPSFDSHIHNPLNILSVVQPSTEPCGFKPLSLHAYCIGSSGAMESQNGPELHLGFRCCRQGIIISHEFHPATVTHTEVKKSF